MSIPQLAYKYGRALYPAEAPHGPPGGLSGALAALYGAPFSGSSHGYSAFLPYSGEPAALGHLASPYELKDSPGIQHPGFPHAHAPFFPYGHYQLGDPSRPKNATRESTSTLKAWLSEHRKNPYPTKGEKIMLAIITKMTLTQVSTWFANARRRLKKENKMTWCSRSRSEDEEEEENIDLEKHEDDEEPLKASETTPEPGKEFGGLPVSPVSMTCEGLTNSPPTEADRIIIESEKRAACASPRPTAAPSPEPSASTQPPEPGHPAQATNPPPKPKLWSLAEMATSDKGSSERAQPCVRAPSPAPLSPPPRAPLPVPPGSAPVLRPRGLLPRLHELQPRTQPAPRARIKSGGRAKGERAQSPHDHGHALRVGLRAQEGR